MRPRTKEQIEKAIKILEQVSEKLKKEKRGIKMSEKYKIDLTVGMSGHFAIMLVWVEEPEYCYWDIQQTGIGRYRTSQEAAKEAISWAHEEEVPINFDPSFYHLEDLAKKLGVKQVENKDTE